MINGRNAYFFHAAESGYMEGIVPLKAVVVNGEGECCGYVTEVCRPVQVNLPKLLKHGYGSPDISGDERLFLDMLSRMRRATLKHGIYFNDLHYENMGILNGRCYFFDLDGIWDLETKLRRHPDQNCDIYLSEKFANKT